MDKEFFFSRVKDELIVSCQALENEPMHGHNIMAKMALAAEQGGAKGIRANGVLDITAIKQTVNLPVIGLIKKVYADSDVYITPTLKEAKQLVDAEADVVAMDATDRKRPSGDSLGTLVRYLKENQRILMADVSNEKEGLIAEELGFDCISTTLSGYTKGTSDINKPNFSLIDSLRRKVNIPVLAEGRIWTPGDALKALRCGAHSVVVGSAITRPQLITQHFSEQLRKGGGF